MMLIRWNRLVKILKIFCLLCKILVLCRITDSNYGSTITSQASEMSFEDVSVCDWSVEDVCRRLKSIQGDVSFL